MTSHITEKKEEKRKALLNSAYFLFTDQGISSTSIAEICKKAGVAKGTFYLYFHDKEDILKALNMRLSHQLLSDAYSYMNKRRQEDSVENIITMAKYLIKRMKKDTDLVLMMKKDFVWDVTEKTFMTLEDPLIQDIRNEIIQYAKDSNQDVTSLLIRLFSMISMIFSVAYSCLIDHLPGDMNTAEKEIYSMIRAVFTPGKEK